MNRKQYLAKRQAYNQAHKKERQAYTQAYNQAHKKERQAYYQAYNQAHKKERQAYYQAHKKEIQAYTQAYKKEIQARRDKSQWEKEVANVPHFSKAVKNALVMDGQTLNKLMVKRGIIKEGEKI
jgi:vacuolar-type H+-ATPase subunit E/Vma4